MVKANNNKANDDDNVLEERDIVIKIFEGKKFLGTITVRLVTYNNGTAKLFDEKGELFAIGEQKNGNIRLGLFSAGGKKRRPSIIGRTCAFESRFGVILTGLTEIRGCGKRR